jgi:hypothetical protein
MRASDVEQVALLALVYRELSEYGATGAPSSADDLYYDLEAIPGEVSLLRMIGSSSLPGFDWTVVRVLGCPEALPALLTDLAELDPWRAEALAHAWPEDAPAPSLSLEILRRWEAVEEAMDAYRALGITATRDEVFHRYVGARIESSAASREEVLDDYFEATASRTKGEP